MDGKEVTSAAPPLPQRARGRSRRKRMNRSEAHRQRKKREGGSETVGFKWTAEIERILTVRWRKDGVDQIDDGEVRTAQTIETVRFRSKG